MRLRQFSAALLLALVSLLWGLSASASGQTAIGVMPGRPVALIADPAVIPFHVAPPPRLQGIRPLAATSTITISYVPAGATGTWGDLCLNWNDPLIAGPAAKAAMEYAASIWASYLTSGVPIVVEACLTNIADPTILGHGGATYVWRDFPSALLPGTWYASALANAMYGSDIADAYFGTPKSDIAVAFNKNFSWHFDQNTSPLPGQYDFASVVLHELGHGLGFFGSMRVVGGVGCWQGDASCVVTPPVYPYAYDRFTQNNLGQSLIGAFTNPSAALMAQLTGDNLFFSGPNANAANGGTAVKIYAPATWTPGSSYSHLDEIYNNTPNALMTYSLASTEVVHDPGPVTRGILKDMGWTIPVCNYSLGSTSASFTATGGTGSISVLASTGCNWDATSAAPSWLHVTSGTPGLGNGSVGYTVDANATTATRSSNISAAGLTFIVSQDGMVSAEFSGTPTTGGAPLAVSFTDLSLNATSWSWNFGDASAVSLQQNPQHVYRSAGTWTVALTASNSGGTNTVTKTNYITASVCTANPICLAGVPSYGPAGLQTAYNNTGAASIELLGIEYTGGLNANGGKVLTLNGGYLCGADSCGFGARSIDSVIVGQVTIASGTITFDRITIQ